VKKKTSKFVERIEKVIADAGGVKNEGKLSGIYSLSLKTKLGNLILSVEAPGKIFSGGSVYTRFENPELAKSVVDCNPYSGKWNFHFSVAMNMNEDEAVAFFQSELKKVM
jgi:hypothetical protein